MSALFRLVALTGISVLAMSAQRTLVSRVEVHDDFEAPALSDLWATDRFAPGAVRLESDIVHGGKQALAITVHSRDMFEPGGTGESDSERAELREADKLVAREGRVYEYSFSMYFPKDFPIVPVRLVIAQWKQYCNGEGKRCSNDSPVLALRYIDGEMQVTQDLAHQHHILWQQKAEFRGRWLNFRIRARFTPDASGHDEVWLDGKEIADLHGPTANVQDATTGYGKPGVFFFKMGLYRNVMEQPMTVYVDDYRKQELFDERF